MLTLTCKRTRSDMRTVLTPHHVLPQTLYCISSHTLPGSVSCISKDERLDNVLRASQ